MRDITEKDIKRALKAFGVEVKQQTAARQDQVIAKLRQEIERLRPHAERLIHGRNKS